MPAGLLKRLSFVPPTLALALAQGCFSTTSDDDAGCSKDTDCVEGRICESKRCVPNPILGSGGTGGSSGTGGTGGSSGTGGTGMACSTSDPILCPSADAMSICVQGTYQTIDCVTACTTLGFEVGPCEATRGCGCGLPTNAACETGVNAFCACVDGTDTPCAENDPVTDPVDLYIRCHTNDPSEDARFLLCLGEQVDAEGSIECQAAGEACL